MNLLGNFSTCPEVCCRGARDTRGEHQERFAYYRLPAGETGLFYGHSRSLSSSNTGEGTESKGKASPSPPPSNLPNLEAPQPR